MFEIQNARPPEHLGPVSDRRLCLTKDKSRVVEETDPEAATLLVGAGCILPAADAEKYGLQLVDGTLVIPSTVTEESAAETPASSEQTPPAE